MHIRYREKPFGMPRPKAVRGEVFIIEDRCKGCGFCVEYCPKNVLELSTKYNAKSYHPPYVKNAEECVNCGFCRMICPEFAIYTVEMAEESVE